MSEEEDWSEGGMKKGGRGRREGGQEVRTEGRKEYLIA